ncbi:MAG: hypothetical protein JSS37_00040 [Proteobacteria bacterium]|nr:hypothetical protein [Pseudomonadota bacterium]
MSDDDPGVNLKKLIELGFSHSECADVVIAMPDLRSRIARAKGGDREAAKGLVGVALGYLLNDEFGPMPLELRRYLARAFSEVALGKSADVAFNLKKPGRPPTSHSTKLRLGHLVYQKMASGETLQNASMELEDQIKEALCMRDENGLHINKEFYGFTLPPDYKTIEGIYCEVRSEIVCMYSKVKKMSNCP